MLKRVRAAAIVFALVGAVPLAAVPQKCYWVCHDGVACDTECDWGDGEMTTCGEFGICGCNIDWNRSSSDYGQHCKEMQYGQWAAWYTSTLHAEYENDCQPAQDYCSSDWVGGSGFYDSEGECCAAEGCYGPSC
jgi:hypothetical protein